MRGLAEASAETGLAAVSVGHVIERARTSRPTFYAHFQNLTECSCALLEACVAAAGDAAAPAWRQRAPWAVRVRDSLAALLELCRREPALARFWVVESLAGDAVLRARRAEVVHALSLALDEGRRTVRSADEPAPLTAEAAVGGALAVVHARMVRPEPDPLAELAGPLLAVILQPYLGVQAARRWLLPVEPPLASPASRPLDPVRYAGRMRLTYRTMRVLGAIAAHPGATNREIARAAGIRDEGQISRLLSRLARSGLLENATDAAARARPNAWRLTPEGKRLQSAVALPVAG
jgi:AcrR family transcriptional regulator